MFGAAILLVTFATLASPTLEEDDLKMSDITKMILYPGVQETQLYIAYEIKDSQRRLAID